MVPIAHKIIQIIKDLRFSIIIIKEYFELMETAKGSNFYKFDRFDVTITAYSDKKLAITVTDPIEKM